MKWKRVPNSWCRKAEGTTASFRGDPGDDEKMFIGRAKIGRRDVMGEKFKEVGRLYIVKCLESN